LPIVVDGKVTCGIAPVDTDLAIAKLPGWPYNAARRRIVKSQLEAGVDGAVVVVPGEEAAAELHVFEACDSVALELLEVQSTGI
jgi:hypothetical protein